MGVDCGVWSVRCEVLGGGKNDWVCRMAGVERYIVSGIV